MRTLAALLTSLFVLVLAGCPTGASPRGHAPRDAARGDAGMGEEEWGDEPYVEDEEESGADDPEDEPTGDELIGDEPEPAEPEGDALDDADLDPDDDADAAWLDEVDEELLEEEDSEEIEGSSACSARCCDGSLALGEESEDAGQCVREAPALCEGGGTVLRARWEGEVEYRRERACYARCAHRAGYRRLYGVTRGCTAQAAAYCEGADRGGLADATWSRCPPA